MKLNALFYAWMLVLAEVKPKAGQNSDCDSFYDSQSVEINCKSDDDTASRNECVAKLFDFVNGAFASKETRRNVKELKVHGCETNAIGSAHLLDRFKYLEVFAVTQIGLKSIGNLRSQYSELKSLNVSYNELSRMPHKMSLKMPNVTIIDISHNSFEDLELCNFWDYHHLSILNVSHNKLSTFHTWLPKRLKVLDISNNRIKSILYGIFNGLNQFKVLNIMNNPVRINYNFLRILLSPFETDASMECIHEIELRRWEMFDDIETVVDVEDEVIFHIERSEIDFAQDKNWFRQLRVFILEYNRRDNTKSLINLLGSSIEHLELSGSYIGEMDGDKFKEFTHLKKLILPNTGLNSFSLRHITNITNLEVLDISANNLHQIDDAPLLANAINLKRFCAQGNQITNIEEVIASLGASIEYLNLNETNLTDLDFTTIKHLDHLKELDISKNNLRRMYTMTELRSFYNLTKFDASDNNLEDGGKLIQNLPSSLLELRMDGNYVGEITANMFNTLLKLKFLYLSRTNLASFSFGTIESLTQLVRLDISQNNLKTVDFALSLKGSKSQLGWLHLDGNDLNELDTLLPEQFPALSTLSILKNRFTCKYTEQFRSQWQQSRKFFHLFDQGCAEETEPSITTTTTTMTSTSMTQNADHESVTKSHTDTSRTEVTNSEKETEASRTERNKSHSDRDTSSNVVLYTVPTGVLIIVFVAVVVLVLMLRRKRTERSELRANVVYRPNATVNKYQFDDNATATSSFNAKSASNVNDHIYEEIKEGPAAYDQLRFDFKPTPAPRPIQIPKPMPFSQNTLDHYDNAKLLRRDYKS